MPQLLVVPESEPANWEFLNDASHENVVEYIKNYRGVVDGDLFAVIDFENKTSTVYEANIEINFSFTTY